MAVIGFTSKLELDPGTGTFATVSETTMITVPAQEVTTVETSYLGMSNPVKTFTPALTDPGVMAFECNYQKDTYNTLNGVRGKLKVNGPIPPTGNPIQWKITAPDEDGGSASNQTFTFNGILTKLEVNIEVEGLMKIKGEVKVSGPITVA